jgi:acyl dehydratase
MRDDECCRMTYFEDLQVGHREEFGSHTFSAEEIKAYARRFDPQPFHVDESAAQASHFGALCASGWHTAAMWMRYFVEHRKTLAAAARARGEPVAESGPSPGLRDLRWPKPVHAGDTVTFAHEIVEVRDATKRPGWGLMVANNTAVNQRGELVLSFRAAKFVQKRGS